MSTTTLSLLPVVEKIGGAPLEVEIQKHRRPRTVESGRLDSDRIQLHLKREELSLTLYEIVEITGLSQGTVLYNFWSGRDKGPVNAKIRSLIEDSYREWNVPANVQRRAALSAMSMREIVDDWARILGASEESTPDERTTAVANALGVHYLTVDRQINEKRDRWGDLRIFNYDRRIHEKAKEYLALRLPFSALSIRTKPDAAQSASERNLKD
jgi:hypothetical protein